MLRQYWKAILMAISTASAPLSEKNTFVSPGGAMSASRLARSTAGTLALPRSVAWATLPSWSMMAWFSSGTLCPCTLSHSEAYPSQYALPRTSKRRTPSPRSMMTGSSSQ